MLQNKRLFIGLVVIVAGITCVATALFITRSTTITPGSAIPSSPHLQSLPPQTNAVSDFGATIANLPTTVTYTQTRNLEETLAYLIDPSKRGGEYKGAFRDGSLTTQPDGTQSFLVDVDSAKKTYVVYDTSRISCAPAASQKEPDWKCEDPSGDEGSYE